MKKLLILILISILWSCSIENTKPTSIKEQQIKKEIISKKTIKTNSWIIKHNKIKIIENNRKKYEARWLIISWTIHIKNDEYILALRNFLKAYNNQPWNSNLEKRIADTYYLMKNWWQAFKYYQKIKTNLNYKNQYINSFFYSLDTNKLKNDKNYLSWTINNIKNLKLLNNQEKFYYSNSLECINDFSLCKKNFQDYIAKNKEQIKNNPYLEHINNALNNYKNFKIDELYFKNTLIIWAFFQNNLYPVVIILWKNILTNKPNYKPILKMIAQSYFELWDYKNAKKYLTKYYALDSNDKDVLYLLALISQKTHDYVLSSIYLTKAKKLWYEPKSNIDRLQIYNAYILDDNQKILVNFDNLINDQKLPLYNDLILATYYNIINWNIKKGEKYADLWIKLYPKIEDFYWFKWWVLINQNKLDEAEKLLQKWYNINSNNALICLNLGRVEYKKNNKIMAMLYYKKAIRLDNWWKISKISQEKLKELENKTLTWTTTN